MVRRALAVLGAALVVTLVECRSRPASPEACATIDKVVDDAPADVVWGYADLHTHPAIELAFGGRLIWGTADDDAPVDATQLPDIEPCPVETHNKDGPSAVARVVGEKVFPRVSALGGFGHGPVGAAWPNARDVVHQQMNVSSIRRAYEGGLRLMFAAATDDQALAAMLHAPTFDGGFAPSDQADFASAKRQLAAIHDMVARNSRWMGIAHTPAEAREIIKAGRLALVLSLELNGLEQQQVHDLVEGYGVQHIIPIHLIDNDIGGTAAQSELFNLESAAVSELYRVDRLSWQYLELVPTTRYARRLGWPMQVATLAPAPIYMNLEDVPFSRYQRMGYEADALLSTCTDNEPRGGAAIVVGQQNARGLCEGTCLSGSGADRIRDLEKLRLLVDVTHMSQRSVEDTLAVDPSRTLIASHSDIAHLCDGNPPIAPSCPTDPPGSSCQDPTLAPVTERNLEAAQARAIVANGGVIGLAMGTGGYDARAVLAARAGPLLTLTPASHTACVAMPSATSGGCAEARGAELPDPTALFGRLEVHTQGGVPSVIYGNAHPFVRVELRTGAAIDAYRRSVIVEPALCTTSTCDAIVTLASPAAADDIESVSLEWRYLACDLACLGDAGMSVQPRQCQSTWDDDKAPHWTIERATVDAVGATRIPLAALGPREGTPIVDLWRKRGALRLFDRGDRPSAGSAAWATGRLLKVSMRASPMTILRGANPSQRGANVCVALRQGIAGACVAATPPAPGAIDCPAGWTPLNQRGEWAPGITLHTLVRRAASDGPPCGVDIAVLDWDPKSAPFAIDDVRVEAIEDPVGHWVRRYAAASRYVAGGALGTFAFGTDFNGLNGTIDFSEDPTPEVRASSVCPVQGQLAPRASTLGTMRFRHPDGSLGDQVRLEDRGLATYGLLADFLARVGEYPGCGKDVRASLMLSAEATLRAWEAIVDPAAAKARAPLPRRSFCCEKPSGVP